MQLLGMSNTCSSWMPRVKLYNITVCMKGAAKTKPETIKRLITIIKILKKENNI